MKGIKKYLFLLIFLNGFIYVGNAQEVYIFTEGTDNTFYDQGIVDVNKLGESNFEYTHPPGGPQWNDKVPCSTTAFKGENALKFNYTSAANGNWQVSIYRKNWTIADISSMDSLSFYVFSGTTLPQNALPLIGLKAEKKSGSGDLTSALYKLEDYNNSVVPNVWTEIKIPLQIFFENDTELNFQKIKGVVFNQSEKNGNSRLFYIDEIRAFKNLSEIPKVEEFSAQGFDSHAELNWVHPLEDLTYLISASFNAGQSFELRAETTNNYYLDFVPEQAKNSNVIYRIVATASGKESAPTETTSEIKDFSDDELLDMVQRYTFRYFWEGAHQTTGMALERSNGNGRTAASGATGMGLLAMIVAHERAYKPKEEVKDRILKILDFLEKCDRHHGAWSHWYNADTYRTQAFSTKDDGGDIVETSFVAQGLIGLKNYFTAADEKSIQIREKSDKLWREIEWNWYRKNNENVLYWHWSPKYNFEMNMKVRGWNECLVTYVMAASSADYGITKEVYEQGWAKNGNMVNQRSFYDYEISLSPNWGGPLFWIHYSHLGINPKNLSDQYANYWKEHVNTAKIHSEYSIENPLGHKNYSDKCWGLTASDDPAGYTAHQPMNNDNGTISPTAALASMPYTPEETMKALKYFYRERGKDLFGIYGPYDAFNDNLNWVKEAYLGIDQGPIVVMIENYRTGLLWQMVMKDTEVQAGLDKLGFQYEVPTTVNKIEKLNDFLVYPNPASEKFFVVLPVQNHEFELKMFNINGVQIKNRSFEKSKDEFVIDCSNLKNGIYFIQITNGKNQQTQKLIVNK